VCEGGEREGKRERERETERQRDRETERQRERQNLKRFLLAWFQLVASAFEAKYGTFLKHSPYSPNAVESGKSHEILFLANASLAI
jgi:hypothetical protein